MFTPVHVAEAHALLDLLRQQGLTLATAESCTGGLIAGILTEVPGSSDVVERGYVTYSNAAKCEALGVNAAVIAEHGAVSASVARAMAQGALKHSRADLAVAVTGVAGPGGGSDDKPVGLVHIALARRGVTVRHAEHRFGDLGRAGVRLATVSAAFAMVAEAVRT